MSDVKDVADGIKRARGRRETRCLMAGTTPELMRMLGITMSKLRLQQILAELMHTKHIRGFSLKAGNTYIKV